MILNPEKLKKIVEDDVRIFYEYDITKDSDEVTRVVSFGYIKPSNGIIVGIVTTKDGVHELTENKDFDARTTGFDEATDYFESLIIKETSPQNQNQENQNSAPPVGLLFAQSNDGIKVFMQDGRTGSFNSLDFIISDNILTFAKTKDGFEKNEKYYVDVIPNAPAPDMFALYPVNEQQGGVTQEIDDYSGQDLKKVAKENRQAQKGGNEGGNEDGNEGGEPSGQGGEPSGQGGEPSGQGGDPSGQGGDPSGQGGNPSGQGGSQGQGQGGDPSGQGGDPSGQGGDPSGQGGDPSGQGGDPSGQGTDAVDGETDSDGDYTVDDPTAKQLLAKTYGMRDLSDLLYNFGGQENLINDLLNFSDMEKSGLLRKLGVEYKNDKQYEAVVRNVINE